MPKVNLDQIDRQEQHNLDVRLDRNKSDRKNPKFVERGLIKVKSKDKQYARTQSRTI